MQSRPSATGVGRQLSGRVLAFLGVGLVGVILYYVGPASLRDAIYAGTGAMGCVALFWLAHRSQGQARTAWLLLGAGVACWTAGDLAWTIMGALDPGAELAFPSYADILYLAGYPALAAAAVLAGRIRAHPQDRGAALEGLMIALAIAVPVYAIWIAPALAYDASLAAKVVTTAYPVMDLLVVACGARLALGSANWSPVALLLALGLVLNIVVDVVYNVQLLEGTYVDPSPIDAGWMVSYLLWGAAALHPHAPDFLRPAQQPASISNRKRTVLLSFILLPPLAVIGRSYITGDPLQSGAVLGALVAISVIMAVRLRDSARDGSARWRSTGWLYSAGFLMVLIALGLAHVQSLGQKRTLAINAMLRAEALVARVSAAEANLDGRRGQAQAVRPEFERTSRSLDRIIERLDRETPAGYPSGGLHADLHAYTGGIKQQLWLYSRGRIQRAEQLDVRRVGPAHASFASRLREARRDVTDTAQRALLVGRTGIVAVLIVALLVLSWLFQRSGAARRAAARAEERSHAIAESEDGFRALISGSADIITVIDADTVVIAHPESVERVLDQPEGSVLGKRLDAFLDEEDRAKTASMLQLLLEAPQGTARTVDWALKRPDGTCMDAEALIINHCDDKRLGGFVLNVRDVTDRRRLEHELQHRAFHDHLTGLANRALLENRLQHALSRSARSVALHAIAFLDLNDFKAVNDSLGHAAGDQLLIEVAARLRGAVRSNDTLARLGGDEFAVLLEDVEDTDEALEVARRLLTTLREPIRLGDSEHVVTASVGIALSDGSGAGSVAERAGRILRNSDVAMYEAKRVGGGSVELFAPEMHDAVSRRLRIKSELQLGLAREELVVHYQPIVSLEDSSVAGFEALVRWNHPERGMVPPGDFIPVAEQTGLIVELGNFVLRRACAQLAAWNRRWPDERRYMSVNVAGPQLQRDQFLGEVAAAIRESGIEPAQLLLEVTETALVQDSEGNERRMSELRELGVRLAIDDFGTGYSSLSYLRRFSMDVLKIDKSFIDHIAEANRDSALVDAMVTMGSTLDLRVVAEGIEDPEQVEALLAIGCPLGQGYLFSRPSAPAEIEALLSAARAAAA